MSKERPKEEGFMSRRVMRRVATLATIVTVGVATALIAGSSALGAGSAQTVCG